MHTLDNDRKIIVRGIGLNSAICAYRLVNMNIRITAFATQNRNVDTFRGVDVIDVEDIPDDAFVIVATSCDTYPDIADELRKKNKREFYDFIYFEWLFKKLVLLHGNCHMSILKEYLSSSVSFTDKYSIYPYPYLVSDTKEFRTEPEIFENTDVWIHEDIRNNNLFGYEVSDEYIRGHISEKTREIIIPHLYGIGHMFFPQSVSDKDGNEPLNNGADTDGLFLHADLVIENCISKGITDIDEIVRFAKSESAIPPEDIRRNFQVWMKKLEERNNAWSIPIEEFIRDNYKKYKLFFDEGHPTNVIFEYIAHEILKRLGTDESFLKAEKLLDDQEKFVYPCVKSILGIEWNEEEIRKKGKKLADHMDFEEYVREYCWWRHHDLFGYIASRVDSK